jgi:putative colanic acid biosynthesis acetyltransferase WcaF
MTPFQDLSRFRLPKDFRGRPGWVVQLWWLVQAILFRPSPQVFYGWRRFLLRLFGARVGDGVLVRPTVEVTYPWKVELGDHCWIGDNVTLYSLDDIRVGAHAVVSQKSYLCAGSHDIADPNFAITRSPITVGAGAWIATDVFVAPGCTIGENTVVGARSSVYRSLSSGMVFVGNPALPVRARITEN